MTLRGPPNAPTIGVRRLRGVAKTFPEVVASSYAWALVTHPGQGHVGDEGRRLTGEEVASVVYGYIGVEGGYLKEDWGIDCC